MLSENETKRNVNDFGQHFTGSKLGIVGMGNIGLEIAKRAHFGFKIWYFLL